MTADEAGGSGQENAFRLDRRARAGQLDVRRQEDVAGQVRGAIRKSIEGEQRREAADNGRRIDRGDVEVRPDLVADAAAEADGQQRMAAEIEEVVMDAHALEPEGLGKQRAEFLLPWGPRWGVFGGGLLVGGRQGVAIELAAGRERQRIEHDEGGGDHVVRQGARQMLVQHRRVRRMTGGGNDIADEALVAGMVFAGDDRSLGAAIMLTERGLDLAGLDAEAADLELMVGTAEKMQRALGTPARTVAGAVHPAARRSERIGDETFGGQARAVEVTARQTAAGDIEFARHSDGHRLQAIVQYIDPRGPEPTPDRRIRPPRARPGPGGADRRF